MVLENERKTEVNSLDVFQHRSKTASPIGDELWLVASKEGNYFPAKVTVIYGVDDGLKC